MVMEVVHEEDGMQCTDHPYKSSSTPGGICAFCLQEKLGKLVSSSFPVAVFPSSSSSPSPSFRSDFGGSSLTVKDPYLASSSATSHSRQREKVKLLFVKKKQKKEEVVRVEDSDSDSTTSFFIRSKSTKTPRRSMHFLDENYAEDNNNSPQRRGFWSFLYSSKHPAVVSKKGDGDLKDSSFTPATPSTVSSTTVGSSSVTGVGGAVRLKEKKSEGFVMVDENESSDEASFDRKVSRSRSVGCGSRSFSNDLFGRISTGFGDCTLRRVESQREARQQKVQSLYKNGGNIGQDGIKEKVRCGGIFSGFMINSSSSSSSYWVASSVDDGSTNVNGKSFSMGHIRHHTRSKSWAWVLASPMRAFGKTPTRKGEASSIKNSTPNLSAIPSLLTVRG